MLKLQNLHHIAVICSDYQKSKKFYTDILGFQVLAENFRLDRNSWKLDLALNGVYLIELFSFPSPPERITNPEAAGLRHIAFSVSDLDQAVESLNAAGVPTETIRIDEFTGKRFTFLTDPDNAPIELYESK